MDKMIKFSILVPVYNAEKYLAECIESVLHQTYQNFELILVDDGSTDSSGMLCDEFVKQDSRIKVFHQQNSGQFAARSIGISNADGDYCVFLDSDDYIRKDTLEVLAKFIKEYGSDVIIYGFSRVTENGQVMYIVSDDLALQMTDKKSVYLKILKDETYNAVWRKAVRREFIGTENLEKYYSVKHGEDLIQTMEFLQNVRSISFIPDVLYSYRDNPRGVMNTYVTDKVDFECYPCVLELLTKTRLFSVNEIKSYKAKVVCAMLVHILCSPLSFCQTAKMLKDLYFHPFVRERKEGIFSDTYIRGQRRFVYCLFEYRLFSLLAGLAVVRRWGKKMFIK